MTISHKFSVVKPKLGPRFYRETGKAPAVAGAFAVRRMVFGYSLKELGSDKFLGDLRLR
jgi:hypothetical protein